MVGLRRLAGRPPPDGRGWYALAARLFPPAATLLWRADAGRLRLIGWFVGANLVGVVLAVLVWRARWPS
jgi:hypothetical protein